MRQYLDAFLIVRTWNNERRVVGTTFSQSEADKSVCALALAMNHMGSEYHTERNPKYVFNDALRVIGEVSA